MNKRILVLGNNLIGSEVQAVGLARRCLLKLSQTNNIDFVRILPSKWIQYLPTQIHQFVSNLIDDPYLGYDHKVIQHTLKTCQPDLIVGCGRSTVMLNRGIKQQHPHITTVQILNPYISSSHFDYIILPRHDTLPKESIENNVLLMTGSIHNKTTDVLNDARENVRLEHTELYKMPLPRVALLLGASHSTHCKYNSQQLENSIIQIIKHVQKCKGSILAIGSRRTPPENMKRIRNVLIKSECPHVSWSPCDTNIKDKDVNGKNAVPTKNPYVAVLALADAIVVTPDSITMTSEAISAKPLSGVHVMLSDVPSGKFRRFFEEIWETNKGDPKSDQKDVNQQTVLDLSNASSCVRRLKINAISDADNDLDTIVERIIHKLNKIYKVQIK